MANEKKMTQEEALNYLENNGRDIVSPEFAKELCSAIGQPYPAKAQQTFNTKRNRVTLYKQGNVVGVGLCDLAKMLVSQLGAEPVRSSPYIGSGTNADYIGTENTKILKQLLNKKQEDGKASPSSQKEAE